MVDVDRRDPALGRIRLRKGAVKRRTVGGIERHIKESLKKAGLGCVRLAYFFFLPTGSYC